MNGALAIIIVCLVILAFFFFPFRRGGRRDNFYTEHGQEEPTRSYTPYTGTLPNGPWGNLPWAEMLPRGALPR